MKSRYLGRDRSIHQQQRKTGIILTNLGTPDAPTSSALRQYLREFLSDPRVVEIPRVIWMLILHGIILRVRPKKSAKLYESIWTKEGSPLLVITEKLRDKVADQLQVSEREDIVLAIGMRYGQPAIGQVLDKFQQQGVDNIVVLPLYPQYAGPTTGSTFDAVVNTIKQWRWIPSLHFINGYYDHPQYISALANTIDEHVAKHGKPEKLVFSYHGMPKYFLESGDPYYCFCHKTTQLVAQQLNLAQEEYVMTFQSRFGKAEWLKPYTDATLTELAQSGTKHVAVISPAFSVDCLETLEELVHENKDIFIQAGGEQYHYIAALNDRDDHCQLIADIIENNLNK
ncbi:ferrochelatase [Thalassotalea sp. G2M2-11]|uniref:ferrochelatase n=1 Tax=Thalassotalea sp. G2M2-11 TaxID=2787627 RepID=UPI0019D287E8|nr:ferrochelatase [Thalassotalea sp. G2M2-11]